MIMGIDACFDREMAILDEQFESGAIDRQEYNKAVQELEEDMSLDTRGPDEWRG